MSLAFSRPSSQAVKAEEGTRKDIQALRAVAVGAVVLGHLWDGRLPGGRAGVDVFFVISGFLITSHLLRKPPIDRETLFAFWARRIRRLLPAAALVLFVTVIGSWALLPAKLAHQTAIEAAAASVYGENWARWFAGKTPDLAALGQTPTQHYWSLSVEEQFYFIWPLIIGAVILFAARSSRATQHINKGLLAGISTIVVVSFLLSVWTTHVNDNLGYFGSHVRFWELAFGGLVGLAYHAGWRLTGVNPWLRVGMSWLGFAMIMASAFKLGGFGFAFPGPWAILPVFGTGMVIAAETDGIRFGLGEVFGWRPIQYIGDISYSAYLWHWPLIMLTPALFNHDPTFAMRMIMGVGTLVLGSLTREFVEEKLRYQRGIVRTVPRSYAMGAVCIVVVLVLSFVAAAATA